MTRKIIDVVKDECEDDELNESEFNHYIQGGLDRLEKCTDGAWYFDGTNGKEIASQETRKGYVEFIELPDGRNALRLTFGPFHWGFALPWSFVVKVSGWYDTIPLDEFHEKAKILERSVNDR